MRKKTGEYLTKGLTESGFVVDLADNGLNGYHLAMTGDYDLLILDIMLPDVNGWDIVRMLRAANKGVPVLLLTALGTVEHRVKGLELGADDYLVKPLPLPSCWRGSEPCCAAVRRPWLKASFRRRICSSIW